MKQTQRFKLPRICYCSIGYLTELKNSGPSKGRQVEVDFPEDHDWSALYDEIERVPPEPLKVNYSLGCTYSEISLVHSLVYLVPTMLCVYIGLVMYRFIVAPVY